MKFYFYLLMFMFLGCKKAESTQISRGYEKKQVKKELTEVKKPSLGNQGEIKGLFYGCGYNYILNENKLLLNPANNREVTQIETILNFTGLSKNFEIYSAPIENAVATLINNQRYILYDPRLLNHADTNSHAYWSSMSILAHEIGHHLQGHTLEKGGSTPDKELEADRFSGHVLYKMGASLEQAIAAINRYGSDTDTPTHPSKYKRINAIKNGWESAAGQRYEAAVPPPPADDRSFGVNGYSKTEFFPEELISHNLKQYLGYSTIDGKEPLIEGIILESDGYEGDFSMKVLVTDDRNVSSDLKYFFGKNKKASVWIPEPGNGDIGTANLSWLEALLVPGRKIAFKPTSYGIGASGNGSWAIIYVKKLNR
jgi:hypothetical protein